MRMTEAEMELAKDYIREVCSGDVPRTVRQVQNDAKSFNDTQVWYITSEAKQLTFLYDNFSTDHKRNASNNAVIIHFGEELKTRENKKKYAEDKKKLSLKWW